MYKVKTNEEIGNYLFKRIEENPNYDSVRQFGKAYLQLQNPNTDISDEELRKMSNRLSQIKQGKKAIQTYDLPYFTRLLGISAEEILSAGEYSVPLNNHITNYYFACSHDASLWEEYINRDDQIFYQKDEYGKNVLDYAFEFKNYDLVKFLLDKKYIWLIGEDLKKPHLSFGANTKIDYMPNGDTNPLKTELIYHDTLRLKMIVLAIEHEDFDTLTKLKAREMPWLYSNGHYIITEQSHYTFDYNFGENYKKIIQNVSFSNKSILDYFTSEFEITNEFNEIQTYIFPYMNELLQTLLENKNPFTKEALKRCLSHNKKVYDKYIVILNKTFNYFVTDRSYEKDFAIKLTLDPMQHYYFTNKDLNFVQLSNFELNESVVTNITKIDINSNDNDFQDLINETNTIYDKIMNFDFTAEDILG